MNCIDMNWSDGTHCGPIWIPACAGMTKLVLDVLEFLHPVMQLIYEPQSPQLYSPLYPFIFPRHPGIITLVIPAEAGIHGQ